MARLPLQVALGVGVGGALVDVSSYVQLDAGVDYRWGRTDAFYGVEPGVIDFVLENADGRFTPDSATSPLDTTLTEGMAACLSVDGRLTACVVRSIQPEFPGSDAAWALVRVSCEDAFGDAARITIEHPTQTAALGVGAGALWPFNDPEGSGFVFGISGSEQPFPAAAQITLGVEGTAPGGGDQGTLTSPAGIAAQLRPTLDPGNLFTSTFGNGTNISAWLTPRNTTSYFECEASLVSSGSLGVVVRFGIQNDRFSIWDGSAYQYSSPFIVGNSYFVAANWSAGTLSFEVNGVVVASFAYLGGGGALADVRLIIGDAAYGPTEVSIANLAVTSEPLLAAAFLSSTAGEYFTALGQMSDATFGTPPTGLSTAPVAAKDLEDASLLDALNALANTEQGHLYTTTTGTLTSPTQTIQLRERDRPTAITASFNVENELQDAPAFIRDITNLISRVTVVGPNDSTVVVVDTLTARASRASRSEDTLLTNRRDRRAWGQDRLIRGANTRMQIQSVVVDAMTTPTDRSAHLLSLLPGDRVQFTGLPGTQLGFDTWDGWFLGAREAHTVEAHTFALYFQPVLPATGTYDTDRFDDVGELTLNTTINSAVTTVLVDTAAGATLSSTDEPYDIQIDDEQMTVTVVGGSFGPQSMTVTRGVNGTTAASHTAGAVVSLVGDYLYGF